jgi:multiple sugar transport system substrate-binding protein
MERREFIKKAGLTGAALAGGSSLAVLLDACGGGASPSASAAEFKGTIEYWVFGYTPGAKRIDAGVAGFQRRNPNIKVNLTGIPFQGGVQKLDAALAAGSGGPDLFGVASDRLPKYVAQGLVEPIDAYMTAEDKADIFSNSLDGVKVKGKYYGWPLWVPPVGIYLNKKTFADRGVTIPSDSWTYDDFVDIAKKMTWTPSTSNQKVYGYTSVVDPSFLGTWTFLYAEGATVLNKDNTKLGFNTPQGIKGLTRVTDLALVHKVTPPDFGTQKEEDIGNAFEKGLLAMYPAASGNVSGWVTKKIDFAVLPPPIGGLGKPITVGGLGTYDIRKQADKSRMAAAMKLAKYFTGKEVVEDYPGWYLAPPARRSAKLDNAPAQMLKFQTMVTYTQLMPAIPQWAEVAEQVSAHIQLAVQGKESPSQAMKAAADAIEPKLKS